MTGETVPNLQLGADHCYRQIGTEKSPIFAYPGQRQWHGRRKNGGVAK